MNNERLMASAGTGKTYALTNRYIQILLQEERPERILAMTFTRKAAGEFFQKVLIKLLEAAESKERATSLSKELKLQPVPPEKFTHLLRIMVASLPHLHLSTLDSFFASLVRCFPMELGLPASPEILPPEEAESIKNRILENALNGENIPKDQDQDLIQVIHELMIGREQGAILNKISELIRGPLSTISDYPNIHLWGNFEHLWSNEFLKGKAKRILEEKEALEALWEELTNTAQNIDLGNNRVNQGMLNAVEKLHVLCQTRILDQPGSILLQLIGSYEELQKPSFSIQYYRKTYEIPENLRILLAQLTGVTLHKVFSTICRRTKALAGFLSYYQGHYQEEIFRSGRLTFEDTARLLNPKIKAGAAHLFSKGEHTHEQIHYRLDSQFDHWLLDEFQDTSRSQWNTIQPLVDEVIQDPEGRRTFFYVGDVKQCLYQWRGSDARLFQEIFETYQPQIIEGSPLKVSWRSRPEILTPVNRLFGNQRLLETQIGSQVSARWQPFWQEHESAPPIREKNKGVSALIRYDKKDRAQFFKQVVQLLETLSPLQRGLSVAILTRKNKDVREIADYLRRHTLLPVTVEADRSPFSDNTAGILLVQWITLALHPTDRAARGMILLYQKEIQESLKTHLSTIRLLLFSKGVQETLDYLIPLIRGSLSRLLKPAEPFPELLDLRLNQCWEAAGTYDERKLADPEEFLNFAQNYLVSDSSNHQSIQILTTHKSKGLDYDIVFLDTPNESFFGEPREPLLVGRNTTTSEVQWILEKPSQKLIDLDPTLSDARTALQEEQAFGELCLLYVGMTRAKSALYMFVEEDLSTASTNSPRNFSSYNATTLLLEALAPLSDSSQDSPSTPLAEQYTSYSQFTPDAILYSTGNPHWYMDYPEMPPVSPRVHQSAPIARLPRRLVRYQPSLDESRQIKVSWLLSSEVEGVLETGTDIHAFFEQIEWLPQESPLLESLKPLQNKLSNERYQQLIRCLENKAWQPFFQKPNLSATQEVVLWKEKAFSLILNEKWINGVFDRVLLFYDKGKLESVKLIDFKTDRIESTQEEQQKVLLHTPQLQIYNQALRVLLGKSISIETYLAFTQNENMIRIAPPEPESE